jgi:hypothetical protein
MFRKLRKVDVITPVIKQHRTRWKRFARLATSYAFSQITYVGFSPSNLLSYLAGPENACTGSAFSHDSFELRTVSNVQSETTKNSREKLAGTPSSINTKESSLLLSPNGFARPTSVYADNVSVALMKSYITASGSLLNLSLYKEWANRMSRFDSSDVKRCSMGNAAGPGETNEKLEELHDEG